ncbi:MAG: hypothetical protein KDD84_14215, partial [Caldilineaceae bacterium]|nr:hypothetical protein [Caldilineaceae bacterium]
GASCAFVDHFWKFALTLVFLVTWTGSAFAHGGTGFPQLTNEDIGPYRIFAWSDPEPAQVGSYHVAVALTESLAGDASGFAGQPVLNADVTVDLINLATGDMLTKKATHLDAVNKIYYEADFEVDTPGEWRVDLTVVGPDGPVQASYVTLISPATFNWMPVLGGATALLLIAGAVFFHFRVQPKQKTVAA